LPAAFFIGDLIREVRSMIAAPDRFKQPKWLLLRVAAACLVSRPAAANKEAPHADQGQKAGNGTRLSAVEQW